MMILHRTHAHWEGINRVTYFIRYHLSFFVVSSPTFSTASVSHFLKLVERGFSSFAVCCLLSILFLSSLLFSLVDPVQRLSGGGYLGSVILDI
ncbi:hypothetical protein BKA80DRAFT_42238 [Phyllosticta citrichinensis]